MMQTGVFRACKCYYKKNVVRTASATALGCHRPGLSPVGSGNEHEMNKRWVQVQSIHRLISVLATQVVLILVFFYLNFFGGVL